MSVVRVLPLYLVVFAGFVGYSLMIAIFTPLVLRPDGDILPHGTSTGARTIALGILLAVYPLAQFLAAPGIGALSDRFGRKRTLLVSLAACCASYALIGGAVQARTLWLLIVACFVAGLTEANVTVAQSAVADIAPVRQRSRLFGYVYLSSSLAYVIGPLGGGRLADRHLVGWFDYATPFWAVTALLLVILAFTAVAFRETAAAPDVSPVRLTAAFRALGTAFRPGPLRHLYAANFVLYLAIFGFFRVYPMYLIGRFHMDVSQESLFVAWVAVPIVAANLGIVGWLSRRLTPRQMVARIAPVLAAGLVAIVIPHTRDSLWVTLAVTALAVAICLPAAAAMISQAAPSDHQGSALGSNQSLQVGAEALTGVAGGLLAAIAVGLPLVTMAVLAAATAVLLSAQRVGTRASEV
ncbi:MAG: MFS transporter [Solirubrobacterales bacterium]|nr:MFS transporter [Solirubrobacterales bacterium]